VPRRKLETHLWAALAGLQRLRITCAFARWNVLSVAQRIGEDNSGAFRSFQLPSTATVSHDLQREQGCSPLLRTHVDHRPRNAAIELMRMIEPPCGMSGKAF
jgi:hypothetical protein